MRKLILLISLFLLIPCLLRGQTGLPAFGSFTPGGFDTINNQNLNVYFSIPLASSPGRGIPLNLPLNYSSSIWKISSSSSWTPLTDAAGNPTWGWQKDFPVGGFTGYSTTTNQVKCYQGSSWYWANVYWYGNYYYKDVLGTQHNFNISFTLSACPAYNNHNPQKGYAEDPTGYYLNATNPTVPVVTSKSGTQVVNGQGTVVDSNGNFVTKTINSGNSSEADWTDSIGNLAIKVIYVPNNSSPTSIQYQFLDNSGAYHTITLTLQNLNVKTNFACSGVSEYTGTATVPSELDIPTPAGGTLKYTFTYEQTPGLTGYYSGRIQRVALPTGGYYEFDYPGADDSINCSDGTTLSLNRKVNDGTNSATWNFVRNTSNLTTTVTTPPLADTPNAFDTVFTFYSTGQEWARQIYAKSAGTTLLRTINTFWASNGTPSEIITTLEDGTTKAATNTTYDANGLLDSIAEYDWGSGTYGSASPIRTTTYTYQTSTNYTSKNILDLVTSKIVADGTGTTQYRQDTAYDGSTLTCPTGAHQHDDTDYPCTLVYRGNPTTFTSYLQPATQGTPITKNFTYDWFGNLLTAQLNCCQSKTWNYSVATQFSQPDNAVSGTSPTLTTSYTYNSYTGLPLSSTDPNNLVTTSTYDFLRRLTQVSQANGAVNGQSASYSYNDTTFVTTVKTTIDSFKSIQQVSSIDGLGRVLVSTTEDVNNNVISKVSANYDLIGRAYKTSNLYTGSPSYWTTAALDVLGRPASVTLPDNSATSYTYAEQYTTVVDPAGKKRKSQIDGAGRLVALTEPDTNNNLNTTTYYSYTVLDGLATVADALSNPTQTRTYVYDALGRLFTSTTPEGGTTCFGTVASGSCTVNTGYDNFDNLLYRTDARGAVTSYTYDGLNRLKGVGYTTTGTTAQATPSVSFTYGTSAAQFNNGALITMTDGVGSENYAYNALEQLTQLQKVISGTTYTTSYAYNIAGELTQITYPSGRVIQQSVDAIGRLCEIAPSTTGCGTAASPYATGYGYNVASEVTGFKYGNGIYASLGFSSDRLQLNCLDYSTTNRSGACAHDSTTKFGLNYSYGSAGSNNGLIAGITDSVDNGRSVAYSYDPLSRLSTALTTGSANYAQWGLSWGYDQYGNRKNQQVTAGTGYQGSVTINPATNHITTSGYTYDASGNMTSDSTNTLIYDAENRAVSATNQSSAGAYVYDGNGLRVKKTSGSTTTVYIFTGSKVVAEYDNGAAPTAPSREYIYGGGALLAKIDSSGTKYYHQDLLSNRLVTDSSGNTYNQMGTFPFGDPWYTTINDKLYLTSYERDSESSNDYAQARFFRWLIGRFLTLDPLPGSTGDPQSLNRYTYVENNPTNATDPSGQMRCEQACPNWNGAGGGGGGGYYDSEDFQIVFVDNTNGFFTGGTGDSGGTTTVSTSVGNSASQTTITTVSASPIDFLYQGGVDLTGGGFGDPSTNPGGGGILSKAISQARLMLSNKDCADFLKSILVNLKMAPNLDSFLAEFDHLTIVPTPANDAKTDPGFPGWGTTAHLAGGVGASSTVHVDNLWASDLVPTLLHETFHDTKYGITDSGLAIATGATDQILQNPDASRAASKQFNMHCMPGKN